MEKNPSIFCFFQIVSYYKLSINRTVTSLVKAEHFITNRTGLYDKTNFYDRTNFYDKTGPLR